PLYYLRLSLVFLLSLLRAAPSSPLFPYTTLFRSLLFLIGLNTDLLQFLRYSHAAALVAVGGNLLSFALGVAVAVTFGLASGPAEDRKSTRLNSSHVSISYAVFCLKKKKKCHHQPF